MLIRTFNSGKFVSTKLGDFQCHNFHIKLLRYGKLAKAVRQKDELINKKL